MYVQRLLRHMKQELSLSAFQTSDFGGASHAAYRAANEWSTAGRDKGVCQICLLGLW